VLNIIDISPIEQFNTLDDATRANIFDLYKRVKKLETLMGENFVVTSGYRTVEDHLRIYSEKGITDQTQIPMASKHLKGMAVDILDSRNVIKKRLEAKPSLLIDCQLWAEKETDGWCHLQTVPPKSSNRWFYP